LISQIIIMRIAFWVRTGNKYGSLERFIALFAEVCKTNGHAFLLINEVENTTPEFCHRLANAGANQVVVGESLQSPTKTLVKALQYLREWKPNIVQLHFVNSLALPLLKSSGIPLVYQTYHSGINHDISLRTRFLRWLDNSFATRVLAVSERVRTDQIRAGVKPIHIKKLYLGLLSRDFIGENLCLKGQEPPGWNDKQCRKVITIGRFFPIKGMRYVVEAAVQVMKERTDIIWWIVGQEGPESQLCNQVIEAAGLRHRITLLGQRNDIPALLSRSSLQVVGSLSEGLGLMALEAAACGVPTIGTRIGGLDEAIVDSVTGMLVESGSSQALAKATIWLLDRSEQRELMGAAARKLVAEKFNAEKQITLLLELFAHDYGERPRHGW
jgi:glycosyltransferase involved in cell wall biosynthesis